MTLETSSRILGCRVDATDYGRATMQILQWARSGESRMVCAANVHMIMEGYDRPEFRQRINGADLVTADGMPLVWALRWLGDQQATRVYGPDLMLAVCEAASEAGIAVGLYGGRPAVITALVTRLQQRFPRLKVAYAHAPPFRRLASEEHARQLNRIHTAGVRILFVGLGCPKQENWMAAQRGRLDTVMLGVGAAFDYHAGRVPQAPVWIRRVGLEWFFRLVLEPRRLWRRYCKHNPRFMWLLARQLWARRSSKEIMQ